MSNSYFMSIVVHLGLVAVAFFVAVPVLEKPADKEITVEIIEIEKAVSKIDAGSSVKIESSPLKAESIKEAKLDKEIQAIKSRVVKSQPVKAGIPETLDDIQATDLDYDAVQIAQTGSLNEKDFDSEFSKIDSKNNEALKKQNTAFDQDLKSASDETENELSNIENENKRNAQVMNESLVATRNQNAALLNRIKAGEAAVAANNARLAGLAKAAADKASALGKVRSLENLKQLNGNPKPQYSIEERFRKEQGTVVFQAFVTNQGLLKDFKLVQSTGYKNLDGKTLAALKRWKFYPGQEGWVEIPQTWNIKGEAEEMPATLRRKISQR